MVKLKSKDPQIMLFSVNCWLFLQKLLTWCCFHNIFCFYSLKNKREKNEKLRSSINIFIFSCFFSSAHSCLWKLCHAYFPQYLFLHFSLCFKFRKFIQLKAKYYPLHYPVFWKTIRFFKQLYIYIDNRRNAQIFNAFLSA